MGEFLPGEKVSVVAFHAGFHLVMFVVNLGYGLVHLRLSLVGLSEIKLPSSEEFQRVSELSI